MVLTSGPLSSSAPDCLSSSLKEYGASHGANVLGSQLAILVAGRAGTKGFNVRASLFVGPRLSVVFPQGVHGASHGANVLGSQLAILVAGRAGTKGFNVRASLFVGPRLSVVFPEGVHGVPWRRRARLPVSDPCGSTRRSFYTHRTTSSSVPSRPDARPMAPWQEIPRTLPPSVPFGFQGSQPPSG